MISKSRLKPGFVAQNLVLYQYATAQDFEVPRAMRKAFGKTGGKLRSRDRYILLSRFRFNARTVQESRP